MATRDQHPLREENRETVAKLLGLGNMEIDPTAIYNNLGPQTWDEMRGRNWDAPIAPKDDLPLPETLWEMQRQFPSGWKNQ